MTNDKLGRKEMKTKQRKQSVLFHTVAAGESVKHNGVVVIKLGPKRAMTTEGKVVLLPDNSSVEKL